jgi:small subunit ribosomal protein S14
MVRKAILVKQQKMMARAMKLREEGTFDRKKFATSPKDKYKTRAYNRCALTGRPRGFMRDFGMSRCCFRELAEQGMIRGVKKSSW